MYRDLDRHYESGHMTVSDRNSGIATPFLNKLEETIERIGKKLEEKIDHEMKHNPVGLFSKIVLCLTCVARIFLGDSDEDVQALKTLVGNEKFRLGCEKEILAQHKETGCITFFDHLD